MGGDCLAGRVTPVEVKARIRGPIVTLPTPFTANFKVDHQAVRNIVRLGLENGIGIYELTAGNSQYNILGYDEIKKLTRVLVEAVDGRGIVIVLQGDPKPALIERGFISRIEQGRNPWA